MRRPRRFAAVVAVAAAFLTAAGPASAHPFLVQAAPEGGAVALAAPREIVLSFSEAVVPAGSRITLLRPDGGAVPLGRPTVRHDRELVAAVRDRLKPAVYTLRWRALGDDGHAVSGTFRFGVPRPGGGAPPGAESLGAPAARGGQSAGGDSPAAVAARWLGLVAAGVLLAGALLRAGLAEGGETRRRRIAVAALFAVTTATSYAVVAAADAGSRTSLRVLVAEPTGVLALVRLGAVLALGIAALSVRARSRRAEGVLLGAAGASALVTYALAGHLQTVSGAPVLAFAAQILHVLAAGTWMGGLVLLVIAAPRDARSLRAFAPLAAASVGILALTGLIAALREVHAWYFLRWSDYGRIVIAKSVLLLALGPAAAASALALRRGRAAGRALRLEAVGALALVVLAATLAGLVPGRGQALPAQRGNLLVGAAFGTVPARGVNVRLTLAPARPGPNTIAAIPVASAGGKPKDTLIGLRSLTLTLRCACARAPLTVPLRRAGTGTWSATVGLPATGTYFAVASVNGAPADAPAALTVGDARVTGSTPREVLMTADLTGTEALRCRATAEGAILAVGQFDARGGLPGGRKVALRVEDDRGDPGRAAALVRARRAHGTIALLAPCGAGAAGALRAAGGLPAIAADPRLPPIPGRNLWRTAGDPRAEGVAVARYMLERGAGLLARGSPRRVAALVLPSPTGGTAASAARLTGLEAGLRPAGVELVPLAPSTASSPGALRRAIDSRRYVGTFLDGDPERLSGPLRAVGAGAIKTAFVNDVLVSASPLLDEHFDERAGPLAFSGAIATPAEVIPSSVDGIRYTTQAQTLYPGDRPSIAGLRGYVAGLTLGEGLRDGDDPGDIAARLRRPRPFTDALVAPWRDDAPAAGDPLFTFLAPRLTSATLVPVLGGHAPAGTFFESGTWSRTSSKVYGPGL